MYVRFLCVLSFTFCCSVCYAQEPLEIPRNQIWGYEIPGTRPLKFGRWSSTGKHISAESPLVEEIFRSLDIIKYDLSSGPSFVVEGTGIDALKNAHAICIKKRKSENMFSSEKELSAFFFSHPAGRYVRIIDVVRHGKEIVIQYRFEPHLDAGLSSHFALIPLGTLLPGKYEIKIIQLPMETQFQNIGVFSLTQKDVERIVCKSSRFTIQSQLIPSSEGPKP